MTAILLIAAAPPPSDDSLIRAAQPALNRVPHVLWKAATGTVADVTGDGKKDVIALGVDKTGAILAVVPGPVRASQPIVLHFKTAKGDAPGPNEVCGNPEDLQLGFEPPGVKPKDLSCPKPGMTPQCHRVLATELRLQKLRTRGAKGIVIKGGKCLPLHLYFDQGAFHWWRND